MPVVAFKDSAGARIQEAVDALSGYGEVFYQNVLLSGVVPQIAIIAGPCAGGASYSPALMDYIIMTRQNAYMFITGPEVIKAVTGRTTSLEDVGSAEMHATVSGNVHFHRRGRPPRDPDRQGAAELHAVQQHRGPAAPALSRSRLVAGRGHQRPDSRNLRRADGCQAGHPAAGGQRSVPGSPRRLGG